MDNAAGENLTLPAPFKTSKNTPKVSITNTGGAEPMSDTQKAAVDRVMDCGSDKLWALASWAKETDNLQPWQRGIVASVAKLVSSNKSPSGKQAFQTMKALGEAEERGFRYTED
jgi:hypothetical protein